MTRRLIPIVLAVAVVHLTLTAYALLSSLYLTVPGEPGFDPSAMQRADLFGRVLSVMGFPILPALMNLLPRGLSDGLLGWAWFALNSLLWAGVIVLGGNAAVRRSRRNPRRSTALEEEPVR